MTVVDNLKELTSVMCHCSTGYDDAEVVALLGTCRKGMGRSCFKLLFPYSSRCYHARDYGLAVCYLEYSLSHCVATDCTYKSCKPNALLTVKGVKYTAKKNSWDILRSAYMFVCVEG
ncbi:hypothetical protein EON65_02085 [archaeon]|nr:MAG: hypothetical protein EON65_02085 [archaeon]